MRHPVPLLLLLPAFAGCLLGVNQCSSGEEDADGDGWTVAAGDCDDTNAAVFPDAEEACDDGVDNNCDGDQQISLSYVQDQVFDRYCITCHGAVQTLGLDLREGRSRAHTVGVPAEELPSMSRVAAGDSQASYLMHKLWGSHLTVGGEGEQMPLGNAPLPADKLAAVQAWIDGGVLETCGGGPEPTPAQVDVSWYKEVQPLLAQRCVSCHTAGGIAPFALDTYEEAAPLSAAIASSTEGGRMPPWMPDETCQTFKGDRSLSPEEVQTLVDWDRAGAPLGDPADATTVTPPPQGLDRVDLTLSAATAYTPSATLSDDYHCFVLNPHLTEDRYLTGHHVRPGQRGLVHHVLLYAGNAADALENDDAEAGEGYTCFGGAEIRGERTVGTWVPGDAATFYPPDTGLRLQAGEVLVMQIHYNTNYEPPAPDLTYVDLRLEADVAVPGTITSMLNSSFSIPPNTFGYEATATTTLGAPLKLWGIFPHMHQLGKRATASYTRAGQKTCLIDIPDWQFNWQQFYFYDVAEGIRLKAGDVVTIGCEWDNATDRTITWGEGTQDEMCITYFYLTN